MPEDQPAGLWMSSNQEDHVALLKSIVEGTARSTGTEFFQSLVRSLATAVGARHAFIAQISTNPGYVRTLAMCNHDRIVDNVEYALVGTPCEDVVHGSLCHHPSRVADHFPNDPPLREMGIESYLGVPLLSKKGEVMGHLAIMDTRPMPDDPRRTWVFRIFADRATAEMERMAMEWSVQASEQRFRDLFEEAPIAYVYETVETEFVSVNRAGMQLLGLKPEDVPGTVGATLVAKTPIAQERLKSAFTDIKQGKERGFMELELRRKDNGNPVWVQFWSRPEPDGKHTRTMIVDITDRVLAEQEKERLSVQNRYLQEEIKAEHNFEEIIGTSPSLGKVLRQVAQVATTDSTVLITGETGTGKELVARAIHSRSQRKDKPLIKLNCAALPAGLVESELFGHEKGAFTGAVEKRLGRFTLANGGTIFLDEIGDMPLETQAKLLRVLQEQEYEPVGATKSLTVDVRAVAATNRDLARAVAEGTFRADLYYRLNVFPIALPPLRDRPDDIPLLTHYFLAKYANRIGRRLEGIDAEAMRVLSVYGWPGNVRELENIIERAVILSLGPLLEIDPDMLKTTSPLPQQSSKRLAEVVDSPVVVRPLAQVEREQVESALSQSNWVIEGPNGAAKLLGLHPNTLRSRMKKMGVERPGS